MDFPQNTAKITWMKILPKKRKTMQRKKPIKVFSEFCKAIHLLYYTIYLVWRKNVFRNQPVSYLARAFNYWTSTDFLDSEDELHSSCGHVSSKTLFS